MIRAGRSAPPDFLLLSWDKTTKSATPKGLVADTRHDSLSARSQNRQDPDASPTNPSSLLQTWMRETGALEQEVTRVDIAKGEPIDDHRPIAAKARQIEGHGRGAIGLNRVEHCSERLGG